VNLRYTRKAAQELADILDYIAAHSPQGQHAVSLRLRDMIELLRQFPTAGPLTDKRQLRRLVVTPYPYLIFYRIADGEIVIHGIRHAARRPASPGT